MVESVGTAKLIPLIRTSIYLTEFVCISLNVVKVIYLIRSLREQRLQNILTHLTYAELNSMQLIKFYLLITAVLYKE